MYKFFDSHGHYDHPRLDGLLTDSVMFFVGNAVIPAITWESNYSGREKFPEETYPYIFFAAGIHPRYINRLEWNAKKDDEFEQLLKDERTVAIKTGLDYSDETLDDIGKSRQREYLDRMIGFANKTGLPLVFHVRDAMDAFISALMVHKLEVDAEIHCFNGTQTDVERLQYVGVKYFGIGGLVTRDNADALRWALTTIPDDRILIETDAPFLKPKGMKGKNNTPCSLMVIASEIARIKERVPSDISIMTYKNAASFFNIENTMGDTSANR